MDFHVDLKEFNEALKKVQKSASKMTEGLSSTKEALNGIIARDAIQGATGQAIEDDINHNQNALVVGLSDAATLLVGEMAQTLSEFKSATGETDDSAVIDSVALTNAKKRLTSYSTQKASLDREFKSIYASLDGIIELKNPSDSFNEKYKAEVKSLDDTLKKVGAFAAKHSKSPTQELLDALKQYTTVNTKLQGLSYSDAQFQQFAANSRFAAAIKGVDNKIQAAERSALQKAKDAQTKALNKQKEWTKHHPLTAFLQGMTTNVGNWWQHDIVDPTRALGKNFPMLKDFSENALALEGFVGAAGDMVGSLAIGASQLAQLLGEADDGLTDLLEGQKIPTWESQDLSSAGHNLENGVKTGGEYLLGAVLASNPVGAVIMNTPGLSDKLPLINSLAETYRNDNAAMIKMSENYLNTAIHDPYAAGGALFQVASLLVPGLGEAGAAADGAEGAADLAKLADAAEVLSDSDKVAEGAEVLTDASKLSLLDRVGSISDYLEKLPDTVSTALKEVKQALSDSLDTVRANVQAISGMDEPELAAANGADFGEVAGDMGKVTEELPNVNVPDTPKVPEVKPEIEETPPYKPEKIELSDGTVAYKSVDGSLVRSPEYLNPDGTIKWPEADGFMVDKVGNPITHDANLQAGQVIDRYGESGGRFTSPVNNGAIAAYDTRGLPYPESTMPYHQYEITQDINIKNVQNAYDKLPSSLKDDLDGEMKNYGFTLQDIANPQEGKISEVFGAGGGTQIELKTSMSWYEKMGLIKEVK